jgi:hypothetical protein
MDDEIGRACNNHMAKTRNVYKEETRLGNLTHISKGF